MALCFFRRSPNNQELKINTILESIKFMFYFHFYTSWSLKMRKFTKRLVLAI